MAKKKQIKKRSRGFHVTPEAGMEWGDRTPPYGFDVDRRGVLVPGGPDEPSEVYFKKGSKYPVMR